LDFTKSSSLLVRVDLNNQEKKKKKNLSLQMIHIKNNK